MSSITYQNLDAIRASLQYTPEAPPAIIDKSSDFPHSDRCYFERRDYKELVDLALPDALDIADYVQTEIDPTLNVLPLLSQTDWIVSRRLPVQRALRRLGILRERAYLADIIEDDNKPKAIAKVFTAEALVGSALLHIPGQRPEELENGILLTTTPHQLATWRSTYPEVKMSSFREVTGNLRFWHFLVPRTLEELGKGSVRQSRQITTRLMREHMPEALKDAA